MKITILTLFPEMLTPMLSQSILGRAIKKGLLDVKTVDIRSYAQNKHKNADDYPFGGGAGMLMLAQPVMDAVADNSAPGTRRIYLSPRGRQLNQKIVEELAGYEELLLLCGHYEGVDQRALDSCIDEELSIGDYVLTGGELGALVVTVAVARLVPGVLGSEASPEDESFSTGLLEYPQYTRPAEFRGMAVPDVLLGGNHADIEAWRRQKSLEITLRRRPELLESAPLTEADLRELERIRHANAIAALLASQGINASRMDYIEERDFPKKWFDAFVPQENRQAAKKRCFSGRRHKGRLGRALSEGFVPGTMAGENPLPLAPAYCLYIEEDALAFRLDSAPLQLDEAFLLCDGEMRFAYAQTETGERFLKPSGDVYTP